MIFSSLIFVVVFLPIVIFLYYLADTKYKNIVLLITSLLFYAYGEPVYVFLMVASIVINYTMAIIIDKINGQARTGKRNTASIFLVLAIVFNLALLWYFKYAGVSADLINLLLGKDKITPVNVALPIGISFFTFQSLSYVVDVYRGTIEVQKNIINIALYISFFPQLIEGPIVRYIDIENQLCAEKREANWDKLSEYSCAMKSHFRKSGNQMSGKWKSSYASLLA